MEVLPNELILTILQIRSRADKGKRDGLMRQVCRLWKDLLPQKATPMCPSLQLESDSLWRWGGKIYTPFLLLNAARVGHLDFFRQAFRDGALRDPSHCTIHEHEPLGKFICFRPSLDKNVCLSQQVTPQPRLCAWHFSIWCAAASHGQIQVLEWIRDHLQPPRMTQHVVKWSIIHGQKEAFMLFGSSLTPLELIEMGFLESLDIYLFRCCSATAVDREFVQWALSLLPPFPLVSDPVEYLGVHVFNDDHQSGRGPWYELLLKLAKFGFFELITEYLRDPCHDPRPVLVGMITMTSDQEFQPERVADLLCSDIFDPEHILPFIFEHTIMLALAGLCASALVEWQGVTRLQRIVEALRLRSFFDRYPDWSFLGADQTRQVVYSLFELGNLATLEWLALPVFSRPGTWHQGVIPEMPWNFLRPRVLWTCALQGGRRGFVSSSSYSESPLSDRFLGSHPAFKFHRMTGEASVALVKFLQDQVRPHLNFRRDRFSCDLYVFLAKKRLTLSLTVDLLEWCWVQENAGALEWIFVRNQLPLAEAVCPLLVAFLRFGRHDLLNFVHSHHRDLVTLSLTSHFDQLLNWTRLCVTSLSILITSLQWLRDQLGLVPPCTLLSWLVKAKPQHFSRASRIKLIDFLYRILGVKWEDETVTQLVRDEFAYDPLQFSSLKTTSCHFAHDQQERK